MFDKQLHRCIFDRKFSSLAKLPDTRPKNTCDILRDYLNRFSQLNHEGLNCGPVLNWLQLDNRGRRILVPESDSCPINTPAVAAAYAVRPYVAQAPDEISFQVSPFHFEREFLMQQHSVQVDCGFLFVCCVISQCKQCNVITKCKDMRETFKMWYFDDL